MQNNIDFNKPSWCLRGGGYTNPLPDDILWYDKVMICFEILYFASYLGNSLIMFFFLEDFSTVS